MYCYSNGPRPVSAYLLIINCSLPYVLCFANLVFSRVPQRRWCAVAQPKCSMKESLQDIVLLLEVGRMAAASSASNESRSLQLLLVLRTLVGGAVLRRTT